VAAHAYTDGSRCAALSLRLPHRMQDTLFDPGKITIGAAKMVEVAGHGILNILILAAAAFEDQAYFDIVLFPLLKMDDRRAGAKIVGTAFARDGIYRVGTQLTALGSFSNRLANFLAQSQLIEAGWSLHEKRRHAGVLTDRAFLFGGHIDILR